MRVHFQPAEPEQLVSPVLATYGGSSSSGLRRDDAGREIVDDPSERPMARREASEPKGPATVTARHCTEPTGSRLPSAGESPWQNAPNRRVRLRSKQPGLVDHTAVLGPEPMLRDADGGETASGEEDVEEHFPQVHSPLKPRRPSQQEVEKHGLTHVPYRAWCGHCVSGRAVRGPH